MRRAYQKQEALDWIVALPAGLIAGLAYIIAQAVLHTLTIGGGASATARYVAATLIGRTWPPPAAGVPIADTALAVVVHLALSALLGLILAIIVYRWRLLITVAVGLVFGLVLYLAVYYGLQSRFAWLADYRGWMSLVSYLLFGGVAAFVYELVERDRIVSSR